MPGMGTPELPVPDGLVLRPFRGVRFAVADPAAVTSPPYDLISEGDVQALLDSHPNNVVRLILPRPPADHSPAERYGAARDALRAWLVEGVLVRDEVPALYVYEQSAPGMLQRGLIGDVGLAAPEQRIVLPHENVMPGPVADRLALMSTTRANLEPILLLYNGDDPNARGRASTLVDEVATARPPLVSTVTADGVRHSLWAITDPAEIGQINADLRPRRALIADGHHRYATYRELQRQEHARRTNPSNGSGPWDFGLALLVDSDAYPPDLKAIHRVIPGLPLEAAAERAKGSWQVADFTDLRAGLTALEHATEPAFLLAGAGTCHLLTSPDPAQLAEAMPAERSARWNALNTSILTEFVLPRVWDMQDDERDVRIVHHDALAAADLAAATGGTAVILNALAVEEVLAVAAEGERVPRKSTSFGPKPRTGLVLRTFDID
ncbi:DUF1015 family protein [Nonomuraea typhae]|uniref:DUF1015 family protein n=1 Tax=Nonomuraea typhae TaxID=2603600 RepID=A0ABW7Z6C0_9ACTN